MSQLGHDFIALLVGIWWNAAPEILSQLPQLMRCLGRHYGGIEKLYHSNMASSRKICFFAFINYGLDQAPIYQYNFVNVVQTQLAAELYQISMNR
jgi:hypothetical protein